MFDPWFPCPAFRRESSDAEAEVRKDWVCPLTEYGMRKLKKMGFTDCTPWHADRFAKEDNGAVARLNLGRQGRVQTHRHLRCRIRSANNPICIPPTRAPAFGEVESEARPTIVRKVVNSGRWVRTGIGLGNSELTIAACHACLCADRTRLENHHGQLNPENRVDTGL